MILVFTYYNIYRLLLYLGFTDITQNNWHVH